MKKTLLLIFILALYHMAGAQGYMNRYDRDPIPVTFGIIGGASFVSHRVTSANSADVLQNPQTKGSFGVNADFRLSDYFSIRPAFMYAGKGGNANGNYNSGIGTATVLNNYTLNYLEVPLTFLAHIPLNNDASIYFGGGPFIAHGLNGKNEQTYSNNTQTQNVYFGSNSDFNKADYGATGVLGFQAGKGWDVNLNFDFGLKNILQTNNFGYDVTLRALKLLFFILG